MLNYDVFEAFRSAGANEEKARKAAEALSGAVHVAEIADLKSTPRLHTWIWGLNAAMLIALLFRAFSG